MVQVCFARTALFDPILIVGEVAFLAYVTLIFWFAHTLFEEMQPRTPREAMLPFQQLLQSEPWLSDEELRQLQHEDDLVPIWVTKYIHAGLVYAYKHNTLFMSTTCAAAAYYLWTNHPEAMVRWVMRDDDIHRD